MLGMIICVWFTQLSQQKFTANILSVEYFVGKLDSMSPVFTFQSIISVPAKSFQA